MRYPVLTKWLAAVLVCLGAAASAKAVTLPDIEYARPDGVPLQLDLETPEGPGPFPAVLFVHGGDFVAGNRKGVNRSLVADLRQAGIAWASIEYRLAPKYHYPAPVEDIESAVRFLKSHAKEYHLDPARLALMGESAGVLLVSYVGATATGESSVAAVVNVSGTHDLVRRFHPQGGCFVGGKFVPNPEPGTPQFCMPKGISAYLDVTGPGADAERRIRKGSPKEHIHRDMPPYLFLHGSADVNAPFEQSVFMFEAMRAAGARADLIVIDGGGHGLGSWDAHPDQATYRPKLLQWLKSTLAVR
jgi:alpha-L-fucosidase 2